MPRFTVDSKYLKHTDLPEGEDMIVTIQSFEKENLGKPGGKQEMKWVIAFRELEKRLGLNSTNGKTICKLYGDEMDDWIGKKIILYTKDDVEFQGELVSAIRVRPRMPGKPLPKPAEEPTHAEV